MKKYALPAGHYTTPTLYAKARGLTRSGIHARINRGEIPIVRVGNQILISLDAIPDKIG